MKVHIPFQPLKMKFDRWTLIDYTRRLPGYLVFCQQAGKIRGSEIFFTSRMPLRLGQLDQLLAIGLCITYLLLNLLGHGVKGFMLLKNRKLAMRSSDTAQVFFEDVRVSSKNLISEEGKGFTYQMLQFQEEWLWGLDTVPTLLETVITQEAIDYTHQQKVFDQSVLHNQAVHFHPAQLATEGELPGSLLCCSVDVGIPRRRMNGYEKVFSPNIKAFNRKIQANIKNPVRMDFPDFTLVGGFWRRETDWGHVCLFFTPLYEIPQRHPDLGKNQIIEQTQNL